jgi:GNAT superfamily N-acetyltransferase
MPDNLTFHELSGQALEPWLDSLGALRIVVFREYPYLYDGSLEYERDYLRTYMNAPESLVVLVTDESQNRKVVGATTCIPLKDEGPEFQEPFRKHRFDANDVCYFGESILLPQLRGKGIGKEFFKRREAHAQRLGVKWTCFCAVDRPADHPMRPAGYRPLDDFWTAQGYKKHPEMQATFVWKEFGEAAESPKTLTFWLKEWKRKS